MRIFTAVIFKKETKDYLGSLRGKIEGVYSGARFVDESNYHMTLAFIGEADRNIVNRVIRATAATAVETGIMEMEMGGISSFRRRNRHTVYCKVTYSEEIMELYRRICAKLHDEGVRIDSKSFMPHITMARQAVKTGGSGEIKTAVHRCMIEEICVMESRRVNGVLKYIPIARFRTGERHEQNNN